MDYSSTMAFLCASGCGFFGSPENRGLCSKCYVADLTAKSAAAIAVEEPIAAAPSDQTESSRSESVIKKRCGSCNKKIGIVGFQCRCGDRFCGAHRYPNEHGCRFDYQEAGRAVIRDQNPVCKADKIAYRI